MFDRVGTKNCVACGKPATMYAGHLKTQIRMTLGNLIDFKMSAGWCSDECYDSMESDENGCYGEYDNTTMDWVEDIFKV